MKLEIFYEAKEKRLIMKISKRANKEISKKNPTNSEQEFEQVLQELESPNYVG